MKRVSLRVPCLCPHISGTASFRLLSLACTLAFLSLCNRSALAQAEAAVSRPDTADVVMRLDLGEIEVQARRTPVVFREAARVITVMTHKHIKELPVSSLPELLEYVTGVDVRQRGPEGIQADLSVRGGTFDQYVLLLNGINISDPQTGHHNLDLPVSFEMIERIEVLEGSAARVHGPNAFSGAINIITLPPDESSFRAQAGYGSHNLRDLFAAASLTAGQTSHSFSASTKSSDGYTDNTDFSQKNLFYALAGSLPSGKIALNAGYTEKSFGANSFYTPVYPDQFEKTRTVFASLKWETSTPVHLTPSLYWRRHHDRFELFRNESPAWYVTHNYHLTDVYGMQVNAWFLTPYGKTSAGAEMRAESILSNVLGDNLRNPVKVPGEDAWFSRFKSRAGFSLFLEHSKQWGRFDLSGGILLHTFSGLPLNHKIYPGFEATFLTTAKSRLFLSANKSLRMPTFTDLYYNGPTNVGNPELRPEENRSLEIGWKYAGESLSGSVSGFSQSGKNLIDWVKFPEDSKWTTSNLTKVTTGGVQMNVRWVPQDTKRAGSFLKEVSGGFTKNVIRKHESDVISHYVLDQLNYKVNLRVALRMTARLTATFGLTGQDREGTYTSYVNGTKGEETKYPPFWIADGKVSYGTKKVTLWISATNLTDKKYFDLGNVVQPGRWLKAGIAVQTGPLTGKNR